MTKSEKIKISIDRKVAFELWRMKNMGESYTEVIRRLIGVYQDKFPNLVRK